jgi:hypothetical protein
MEVQKGEIPAPIVKTDVPVLRDPDPKPVLPPKCDIERTRAFRSALRDHMYFDTSADGTVWVRGRTYKASFGNDGATYIPFLGPCAPQNYPVHTTIDSITSGAQPVEFDGLAPAIRDGTRVSFDRGGVVEIYDVSLDSVEQSFVFTSVPSSDELVVRLGVESELERSESDEGFEFWNERGAVRYARAQVRDATGSALSSTTALTAVGIEIRVAAAEIARARFPLTVDPVISTFTIDTTTQDDYIPDVAYDPNTGRYCVCEEETVSASDHDVIAFEIDSTGAVIGVGVCVDCTSAYWQTPKIANDVFPSPGQFLVVAAVGQPASGTRTIWGRRIAAPSFSMGPEFQVSPTDQGGDKLNPDVGGGPWGGAITLGYLVVWTRIYTSSDFDVHGVVLGPAGPPSPNTILIDNSAFTADTVPHISKSSGPSGLFLVVWNRDFTPADRDVRGALINYLGQIVVPSTPIDSSAFDDTYPRVSSPLEFFLLPNELHYLIVYQRFSSPFNHDIVGTLVSTDLNNFSLSVLDSQNLSVTFENAFNAEDQIHPSVDTDGAHFQVAYSEQYGTSATDYDIYVSDYAESESSIVATEVHQNLAFTSNAELNPLIASSGSDSGFSPRCMIVWDRQVSSVQRDTEGGLYDSVPGGPITSFCPGDGSGTACPCGNSGAPGHGCANSVVPAGALLSTTGHASTAPDNLVLIGSGQPASAPGVFFQGTVSLGTGTPLFDGLHCVGGTVIRLGTKTASGGVSQYPSVPTDPSVSVRGMVPLTGGTRYYQLWYRDPNTTFCTSATSNFTNGVKVVWTP